MKERNTITVPRCVFSPQQNPSMTQRNQTFREIFVIQLICYQVNLRINEVCYYLKLAKLLKDQNYFVKKLMCNSLKEMMLPCIYILVLFGMTDTPELTFFFKGVLFSVIEVIQQSHATNYTI